MKTSDQIAIKRGTSLAQWDGVHRPNPAQAAPHLLRQTRGGAGPETLILWVAVAAVGLVGLRGLGGAMGTAIDGDGQGGPQAMAVSQAAGVLSEAAEVGRATLHAADDGARIGAEVASHDGAARIITLEDVKKAAAALTDEEWRPRLAPGVDPNARWQDLPLVVVDFEGSQHNAHEIGFAEIDKGELLDSMTVRLATGGELPSRAVELRRLGEKVTETSALPFAGKLDRVMTFLEGRVPVAYNYAWDAKHLQNEWALLAKAPKVTPAAATAGVEWIDVLDWIRMLRNEPQNNSLSAAFRRITGEELVNAHSGEVDARAAARVLWSLRGEMPETYGDVIRHQIAFRKLRGAGGEVEALPELPSVLDAAPAGRAGLPAAFAARSHWAKGRMASIDVRMAKNGARASEIGVALFDKGALTEARTFPVVAREGRTLDKVMREVVAYLSPKDGGGDYFPVAYNAESHRVRLITALQHGHEAGAKFTAAELPPVFETPAFIDPLPWVRERVPVQGPATLEAVTAALGVPLPNPMNALDRAIAAGQVALRLDEMGAPKTLGAFLDAQDELRLARAEGRQANVPTAQRAAEGAVPAPVAKDLSKRLDPAASWLKGDLVAIDFEATGANPQRDHIIEIGWAIIRDGKVVEKRSVLVDPGVPISDEVAELTGITDEMIKHGDPARGMAPGRPLEEVLPMLNLYWEGYQPVAHNVGYDRTLLHAERDRLVREGKIGKPDQWAIALDPEADWIDTLRIVRRLLPKSEQVVDHRLGTLVEHLNIKLDSWHRAGDDATAAGKILLTVGKRRLSRMTWRELFDFQNMSPKDFLAKSAKEQAAVLRGSL